MWRHRALATMAGVCLVADVEARWLQEKTQAQVQETRATYVQSSAELSSPLGVGPGALFWALLITLS